MANKLISVLVVGPDRTDPGGVANYYNAVFPRLSGHGIEAQYLSVGSTHGRHSGVHRLVDQIRFWRAIGHIRPDIVHLNPSLDLRGFFREGLFIFLAKLRRQRVLVYFRGWETPFESKVEGPFHWFFSISYKRADAYIVLAQQFAKRLKSWGVSVPIYQATTAVEDEHLKGFLIEDKVEEMYSAPVVRLLYLARLERQKGVLQLLEAVRLLLQGGSKIELTIAGDGPLMAEVKERIAGLGGNKSKIHLVGYVRDSEKTAVLKSHHIYCFPTQYGEGMPNSLLEAMAFGMPVVTCPVGGVADFFEAAHMGIVLHDQDVGRMAEGIEKLISRRDRLVGMARYNSDYAKRNFLASKVAADLRGRYTGMIG